MRPMIKILMALLMMPYVILKSAFSNDKKRR